MARDERLITSFSARLELAPEQEALVLAAGKQFQQSSARTLRLLSEDMPVTQIERELRASTGWSRRWARAIITEATMRRSSAIELAKVNLIGIDDRLARLEKRARKTRDPFKRSKHYERLDRQRQRKIQLERAATGDVSICYGGRKLARQRHATEDAAAWREEWERARYGLLYMPGDRDRKHGNPALQLDPESKQLTIILPGGERFTAPITTTDRRYERFFDAYDGPVTVTIRYSRAKGHWYADFTLREAITPVITSRSNGAIGVDLNVDHYAIARVDSSGNPVEWKRIDIVMGVAAHATERRASQTAREIVALAVEHEVPIVMERLNFGYARLGLRYLGAAKARAFSSFAYSTYLTALQRAARRAGVEVILVTPAYTSLLGQANYAATHGVSVDLASACVIARRGLRLNEQVRPSVVRRLALEVEAKSGQNRRTADQAVIRLLGKALPARRETWGTIELQRSCCSAQPALEPGKPLLDQHGTSPLPAGSARALTRAATPSVRTPSHRPVRSERPDATDTHGTGSVTLADSCQE